MINLPHNINFLEYSVFTDALNKLPSAKKVLISTINQYSYCIAKKDFLFKNALSNSDVLLPDGMAIVWATKFLYGKKIKKNAGSDVHKFLLKKLNETSGSCFYLGSSPETLSRIKERVSVEFPNINIEVHSPAFKPNFSALESEQMIKVVNNFKPDVLFVGMTAPKQEKWSYEHKEQLDAKIICSVGAVFDFYAGTVERPNKIWRDNGLEWFGRLLKEPKRLWKRYLYYGLIFLGYLLEEKWKLVLK